MIIDTSSSDVFHEALHQYTDGIDGVHDAKIGGTPLLDMCRAVVAPCRVEEPAGRQCHMIALLPKPYFVTMAITIKYCSGTSLVCTGHGIGFRLGLMGRQPPAHATTGPFQP